MSEDCVQRFLFDGLDVRGALVRLGPVWRELLARRDYPAPVIELLGQMCAMTVLLTDNLKQPGRLTIQLRGKGPVSLLVIDSSAALNVRCMAQHEPALGEGTPVELLGAGQLMLSLDTPAMRVPYQSIVPLAGDSIAEIFEHYLSQSEQIASRFFLAATPAGAAGLFLQKMPAAETHDADAWARCTALAATVKAEELLALPSEALLTRLFNQESVRLFAARPVTHIVPEDWEKMRNMLRTLGREEVYAAIKRIGEIVIRDDLGNLEYRFDKAAIDALFSNTPETPPSVH
jgi:molecular chaperone Hsp33